MTNHVKNLVPLLLGVLAGVGVTQLRAGRDRITGLMGPRGMDELARGIMQRARYAAERINELEGASVPHLDGAFFKEFVVDFGLSGKSVADINAALLARGIFGGKDISTEFPLMGQSALYCVTEIHGKKEINKLVDTLQEVLS